MRLDLAGVRVTKGSEARSQEPPSSSADEREAKEDDVLLGGKMRSLMWLERQRGVGMESYEEIISRGRTSDGE